MRKNGLRTFALHAEDEASSKALEALRAKRPHVAAFSMVDEIGLSPDVRGSVAKGLEA